ncbi:hypothetical protein [Novosphingobium arvoryzae]|uniref:hypothetical protein n=1 Tax=Novosphingobium arvoryzae TaxID=1256514 RepID=UPI0035AEFC54
MRRFALLPALALIAAPSYAEPVKTEPAQTPQTKALIAAEKQWASYDAQSTGCGFTTTTVDVIQRREISLQRKLAKLGDPTIKVAPVKVAPVGCNGPFHGEVIGATMVTTWDWLTRLNTYSAARSTAGWTQGIARTGIYAEATHQALMTGLTDSLVKSNSKAVMDQRRQALQQEAVAVMILMCRERRPAASDCPEVPAGLKGQEAMARARLAEIERAALQLEAPAKRDEVDAIGVAWRLQKDAKDTSTRCVDGDRVIFPHSKETKRGILPGQIMLYLREWGLLTPTNTDNPDELVTIGETPDGFQLLYSTELKVGFRDPVKRKFIACEAF